ncbi:MAG: hypothetical protein V3W14_05515 [Candidatus Neomarinimicrobiota bacterium]
MDNYIKPAIERLNRLLDPWLDRLFLLQPSLLIPVWTFMAAGLGMGAGSRTPDIFWRVSWNSTLALLFIGGSLISGAAFIFVRQSPQRKAGSSGMPILTGTRTPDGREARKMALILLAIGLVFVFPSGLWAVVAGGLLFCIWGLLYAYRPPFGGFGPLVDSLLHGGAAGCLFYLGWNTGSVDPTGSWIYMLPYILIFTAIGALTTIYPQLAPRSSSAAETGPSRAILIVTSLLTVAAGLLGIANSDPMITTSTALILPFHLVALIYLRPVDIFRTVRYSLLILVIFVGARYPLLYPPIIAAFYLSRYYYRRRYGQPYPTMEGTLWNLGLGLEHTGEAQND